MTESEFLPEGFFICDSCDDIHRVEDRRSVADMDGEEGDHWQLCVTCESTWPSGVTKE